MSVEGPSADRLMVTNRSTHPVARIPPTPSPGRTGRANPPDAGPKPCVRTLVAECVPPSLSGWRERFLRASDSFAQGVRGTFLEAFSLFTGLSTDSAGSPQAGRLTHSLVPSPCGQTPPATPPCALPVPPKRHRAPWSARAMTWCDRIAPTITPQQPCAAMLRADGADTARAPLRVFGAVGRAPFRVFGAAGGAPSRVLGRLGGRRREDLADRLLLLGLEPVLGAAEGPVRRQRHL